MGKAAISTQPGGAGEIPAADLLPVQREATFAFRVVRMVVGPIFKLLLPLEVAGRENLPSSGPYVVIANHLNWADPFVLLLALPVEPRLHFLANPENLVKNRVHWWLVRQVRGYICVDVKREHQDPALFRHVERCLVSGGVVGLFPEAAYGSHEGQLQATWKKGFAHFAVGGQVPVVPVAIVGTKDLWLRKRLRVAIGKAEAPGEDAEMLAATMRTRLAELLPPYVEPRGRKLLRRQLTRLLY